MKIFISWSGTLSLNVAEALRDWLPSVIQSVKPYVSSEDTRKGSRWSNEVSHELETSNYGILCLTPESLSAPWLNFEAGALSKFVSQGHVSPLLIDVKRSDVTWPLAQFQSTLYQYGDVLRLIKGINSISDNPLETVSLERIFKVWWPELKVRIDQSIKDHTEVAKSKSVTRSTEDMLRELLDLTRMQQKFLSDSIDLPSRDSAANGAPKIIRDVDFTEVKYFLARIRSAIDEAIVLGEPETSKLVELRGLILVLSKILTPALE